MKLTELFIQRHIISDLIERKCNEISEWSMQKMRETPLEHVQFTPHNFCPKFHISVTDTSLKDESLDSFTKTVFRKLFSIRDFEICEITELFDSFPEEKKKAIMDFTHTFIDTWKDK